MVQNKPSKFFQHIECVQEDRPWGAFLDAGTGVHSLSWVMKLKTERWTAVTGAPGDARLVEDASRRFRREQDRIVVGNWAKADLLAGEEYDTVLADYLLGAVEGFAPYFQPYLFARLRPLTKKVLYLTGVEPYVPANEPVEPAARLVWKIGRFRDACLLLTGGLPYREYPSAWVQDQLKRSGFNVHSIQRFNTRYKSQFINSQVDLSLRALKQLCDRKSTSTLTEYGEKLRAEALELSAKKSGLASGSEYVIVAHPT